MQYLYSNIFVPHMSDNMLYNIYTVYISSPYVWKHVVQYLYSINLFPICLITCCAISIQYIFIPHMSDNMLCNIYTVYICSPYVWEHVVQYLYSIYLFPLCMITCLQYLYSIYLFCLRTISDLTSELSNIQTINV